MSDTQIKPPANAIVFFEIPALDFQRALDFYSKVFNVTFPVIEKTDPPRRFARFPMHQNGVAGAVVEMEGMVPAATGTLVYLDGGGNMSPILDRVVQAGGSILVPKTQLQEGVFFAHFRDSEGNRLGLFSPN